VELTNNIILLAGLLCSASVLISVITTRLGMPLLLAFLGLGMLAGEDGPGQIHFENVEVTYVVGTLALAVILFNGGLCTRINTFRVGLWPALWLATLGVAISAGVTGLAATWLLPVHWIEGLLIGAIVGSTDAAAVFSVLHSRGLQLKERVDATLQIESGINDPMAIFLTLTLVNLLASGAGSFDQQVLWLFVQQMGLGGALGLLGGWALGGLINRVSLTLGLYPLLAFSGALLIFGVTAAVGGSGYLAVYLAGLVMGNRPLQGAQNIHRFHDGLAWLGQISMFLILGLLVTPSRLIPVAPDSLLIGLTLILVARPLAVGVCLLPFRFPWRERLFIAWVGLRGAVPIVLALFPLLAGLENAPLFFNVIFFVVLVSLIVQGWTVALAARWLELELPPRPGVLHRMELDLPGQRRYELVAYRLDADNPAIDHPLPREGLPRATSLAGVVRGEELLDSHHVDTLLEGDHVYLVAQSEDLPVLDELFASTALPMRLDPHHFFGDLVLDGQAGMAEVVAFYGLQVDPETLASTLEDALVRVFQKPVVGDRLTVGAVEFVVREMHENRITRVSMKLAPVAPDTDTG